MTINFDQNGNKLVNMMLNSLLIFSDEHVSPNSIGKIGSLILKPKLKTHKHFLAQ